MADSFQFDLVSPERRLASVEVRSVRIPGTDGDMTAMAGHTPVITTLRPGLVSAEGPDGTTEYVVSGGFAEISANSVAVLAERAVPRKEATQEFMDEMRQEAEAAHEAASDGAAKDATAKVLGDLTQLARDMASDPALRGSGAPAPG